MNKAAQFSQKLEQALKQAGMAEVMGLIEKSGEEALYFDTIKDAYCVMHDDGSVNIVDLRGHGVVTSEVISAENILKVLNHYRPFKDVLTHPGH